jgi:rhodanese-related sulfurtransferase
MSFLKKLFGIKSIDYNELMDNGAYIIDVRTPGEFSMGKIKGAKSQLYFVVHQALEVVRQL